MQIGHHFMYGIRTGNWDLYIDSMKAMLPYLHASGHLHYAKGVHIHVQRMERLEEDLDPSDFDTFVRRGNFTVRHTSKFFKALPMDLTIEQKLMRHLKTCGLTRGRGITDNTLAEFIAAMPRCVPVCHRLEEFCGLHREVSEQHVELRGSRMVRDMRDLEKVLEWFEVHPPFEQRPQDMLVSLSSGLVADSTVNCDSAWEIGMKCIDAMHSNNFGDLKLKRKDKVKSLAAIPHNVVIQGESVAINPTQLLHRIICVLNATHQNLAEFLEYELAPRPPSLFDDVSMRKTNKSALASFIASQYPTTDKIPSDVCCVVDGGMLLRAIVWPRPVTYGEICESYRNYVLKHYGSSVKVVFDGYDAPQLSTKNAEQQRRCRGKTSATVTVRAENMVVTAQQNFLSNGQNKTSLIRIMSPVLENAGISVRQAVADADTLIVEEALKMLEKKRPVFVGGNDTDLLAILIQRCPEDGQMYFGVPGTASKPMKVYNIHESQKSLGGLKDVILFAHAVTGCDTTSALHGKGKMSMAKLLKGSEDLQREASIFNSPNARENDLISAGEKLLIALYIGKSASLDSLRFAMYNKLAVNKKISANFDLKSLPPTSAAAKMHILRVYLQVQEWLSRPLEPTKFGWKQINGRLVPIPCEMAPAPETLLNVIRCNCKKGCTVGCECRRSGLTCKPMCGTCQGVDCTNTEMPTEECDDDSDSDD